MAARVVSSCGWFYGFKLHLITNHVGEIISFAITKGNISDQNITAKLAKKLSGFLFGDKGYLSTRTAAELLKHGPSPHHKSSTKHEAKTNFCSK